MGTLNPFNFNKVASNSRTVASIKSERESREEHIGDMIQDLEETRDVAFPHRGGKREGQNERSVVAVLERGKGLKQNKL